jgi:phage terminase large subunit GpA-like protein
VIEEHDRCRMVRAGRWIATAPAPGRKPGYHFDGLASPFVPWAKIAERYVGAAGDPRRLKGFWNLTLGLPFEMKGDAPSHEILMLRREPGLKRGHLPPKGLLLVASADVQANGIWYEVLAVARTRETWVVDAGFLAGSTESPDGEAFEQLKERVLNRDWPDAWADAEARCIWSRFGLSSAVRLLVDQGESAVQSADPRNACRSGPKGGFRMESPGHRYPHRRRH